MVGKKLSEKPTAKKDTDKKSANKGRKATSTPPKSKKIKATGTAKTAPIPERSAVARDALQAFNEQLTRLGFTSVFEVVRRGRTQVVAHLLQQPALGLQHQQAVDFYEQAQTRAASLTRLYAQLCARSEPAMRGLSKLGVHYNRTLMQRSLGGGGNYDDWFKPASGTEFAHPDSVGSLFSPASYLTDLYRAAKPLHPAVHGLQLDNRRPDLGSLTLNDANLHEEISTLALTLEVLDAGVEGDVDELLRTTVYPMNLPYNHASERIFQGLAARKNSLVDIWSVMGDFEGAALYMDTDLPNWTARMPVGYARDVLGMSPELVNILTEPRKSSYAYVARYFGRSGTSYIMQTEDLQKALKLPEETILAALGAGPYFSGKPERLVIFESDITIGLAIPYGGGLRLFFLKDFIVSFGPDNHLNLEFKAESGLEDYSLTCVIGNSYLASLKPLICQKKQLLGDQLYSVSFDLSVAQYFAKELPVSLKATSKEQPEEFGVTDEPLVIRSSWEYITPQAYGARYINGWDDNGDLDAAKPLYWYVGAALGQPVPEPENSPLGSGLHNRDYRAYDRLNRLVRLQRHVKVLSFEELDWLISQANEDITATPLAQTLEALAVYLPLRKRYGMTVNSFAACLGVLNTFYTTGKQSFYTTLFGATDLLGQGAIDFNPITLSELSFSVRARLCQGLQIDDATLVLLAHYLPDFSSNSLPKLELTHITALYRLVAIPRLFGLSVVEALNVWELLGESGAIATALAQPKPGQIALGVLVRTGYLVDWLKAEQLEPAQLIALTGRGYPTQLTSELQAFIENIYSTLTGRETVSPERQAVEDSVMSAQLARHIGAEFGLKPNIAAAMLVWVDTVVATMNSELNDYGLLRFWQDIQAFCEGDKTDTAHIVQYAFLLRQFAQVCHWAELGEQDLALLMPGIAPQRPSALTGLSTAPLLTLDFLLLLSRYRRWQRQLLVPFAQAREFLRRAAEQDSELTVEVAIHVISDLHGWDSAQVKVLINLTIPRSFVALWPLLQKMQLSQRLNVAPANLFLISLIAGSVIEQPKLEQIAAMVIAAAHG